MNYKRGETPAVWKVFRWIRPLISLFSNIAEDYKPRELIPPSKTNRPTVAAWIMLPVSQSIVQKKKRGEKDLIVALFVKKNISFQSL